MAAVFAVPLTAAEESKRPIDWGKLHAHKSKRQREIIQEFFRGRRDGTFVDVGSAHYRDGSMTFFLEKEFGWSGVAIDALEHWGAGYAEHRPRTRFFNYIVTDHTGAEEPFYRLQGDIGSTALKERADRFGELGTQVTEVLVPTTTMDQLLDGIPITKIDFLSMDIKGGEPAALAGFDIERFRPELVGVEAFPSSQEAILAYFEQHGYRRIDAYFKRHKEDWFFTCKVEAACASKPKPPGAQDPTGGSEDPASESEDFAR